MEGSAVGFRGSRPRPSLVLAAVRIRICPLAATKKTSWPSQSVTDSLVDAPPRCPADYELLTAADNSSVVRCRIANSVHQMHEASGRILALATPLCFTRSPGTRPGPAGQMAGWLCRRAASMVGGGQVNQVRRPVACRYVAAVPELSAGLPGIPGLPWESLSHRQVLAELAAGGWVPCGVGDWAVALRSPEGTLAARVCPFDPAYWAFVDLCRECAGNRWLPRIELAAGLEGGEIGRASCRERV